jgi:hypothetical protein
MPFYIVENFNNDVGIFDSSWVFGSPILDENGIVINEDFKRIYADVILPNGTIDEDNGPVITGPMELARINLRGIYSVPLKWNEQDQEYYNLADDDETYYDNLTDLMDMADRAQKD